MSRFLNIATNKTMITCFVCDQKAGGDRVNLAASVSAHSKVTLPEKISQLIGDDFVVAVTEQDCVCKRCASLLNHMDKLENELMLVKRALASNISTKYKITLEGHSATAQGLSNGGLKTDSTSDYEDDSRKNTPDVIKKKPIVTNKPITPLVPKSVKPNESVTKLKIYKCGFCSYQSKELSNVRLHMKIHIRAGGKPENEVEKPATSTPVLTAAPKTAAPAARRRVFRCQVCSQSFDDRSKCLEHISKDHTAAGRKTDYQKTMDNTTPNDGTVDHNVRNGATQDESSNGDQTMGDPDVQKLPDEPESQQEEEMDIGDDAGIKDTHDSKTFDTEAELVDHANEHTHIDGGGEADTEKSQDSNFSQMATQPEDDDESSKDGPMQIDIEAMIAALHSEGPEGSDSMPNI